MDIDKIARLVEFDTPTVANGLGRLKVVDPCAGYTGPDIRALMPEMGPRVGVAVTVRLDTTTPGQGSAVDAAFEWFDLVFRTAQMDGHGGLPVFAIIQGIGQRPRQTVTLGDGTATVLRLAGAVGFLTNACIRDVEGVREVGLPCWGAGLSPMHGEERWSEPNRPVVVDGVTIHPGDILHADANGVLVIPAAVADQVYDAAAEVHRGEQANFAIWHAPGFTYEKWKASLK